MIFLVKYYLDILQHLYVRYVILCLVISIFNGREINRLFLVDWFNDKMTVRYFAWRNKIYWR